MSWEDFLDNAPERVEEVIREGPMPYTEYGGSKLTPRDKHLGMVTFKGGNGRGGVPVKHGQRAVVYFDPYFVSPEHDLGEVPENVKERHSDEEVVAEFKKL